MNLIKEKDHAHRRMIVHQHYPDADDFRLAYTKIRNKVTSLTRKEIRQHEISIATQAKEKPKLIWAYANRKLKTRSGVSPLLKDVNDASSMVHTNSEKAQVLQDQFCSVFTAEPQEQALPELNFRCENEMPNIVFLVESIAKKLKALKAGKSGGTDELQSEMLKHLADLLAAPLAKLFKLSYTSGVLPADWKTSIVSPIFKKGARKIAANYRPVSLTCILCKVMESLVREAVIQHAITQELLSSKQYGFVGGRSTTLQLLSYVDELAETMADGGVTDVIHLDFAKAFDSVPYDLEPCWLTSINWFLSR